VGAVALAMVVSMPFTLYAHSPDLAFYIGKTIWAARGEPLIDPAMGIVTGYPVGFFVLWGWIVEFLGAVPITLLRWATVWNLLALWLVLWLFGRRLLGPDRVTTVLWVGSLALFAKEIGGCLFASPACFSMPLAIAAWWFWIVAPRPITTILGAFLLAGAIVIWPAHLFGALGVGLVMGWRRVRSPPAWVYAAAIVLAGLTAWRICQAVPSGEPPSCMRLIPPHLVDFLRTRVLSLVTLGTDGHGLMISVGGAATFGALIYLALRGWHRRVRGSELSDTLPLGIGLTVGALLSAWFMIQPAFAIRILFLAAVAVTPLAANGLHDLLDVRRLQPFHLRRLGTVAFGSLWLVPFLVSAAVSVQWDHRWEARTHAVSEWLAVQAQPGERVWATPGTYRDVVLGKAPVFGFLAHHWPPYYGAPRSAADSIATVYTSLSELERGDDPLRTLARAGVDWVVVDRGCDGEHSLVHTLAESITPRYADTAYVVYRVEGR